MRPPAAFSNGELEGQSPLKMRLGVAALSGFYTFTNISRFTGYIRMVGPDPSVFPGSRALGMVEDSVFPDSRVLRMVGPSVFPDSQVTKLVCPAVYPDSHVERSSLETQMNFS